MKITRLFTFTITILIFVTNISSASDFYGATVIDKDVPSSYMKYSIYGQRSIISDILENSPASKAGFKCGDIILAVNDKDVKRSSELNKFTENTLAVQVFDGSERKTITLDRLAIETEKSRQLAAEKKPASAASAPLNKRAYTIIIRPDSRPALTFDNAALDRKYGKTSPVEFARQKHIADATRQAEQNQLVEAERAKSQRELITREAKQNAELKKLIDQTNKLTARRGQSAETTATVHGVDNIYIPPVTPNINNGNIITSTGELLIPAGDGHIGTRDGTFYAPAGPNGIIDTRTGQFLPTF